MNDLFGQVRLFAREQWSRIKVQAAARRLREREVNLTVERLVDRANPRLRALPGYRRKLFEAVAGCLDYCSDLAQRIPGPLTLDRPNWGTDPLLNALFGDWERIRQVLTCPAVRDYAKQTDLQGGDCYGVLAALPLTRNQLGIELVGDDLHRDVQQTVMTFVNHEVVLPGPDEASVRAQSAQAIMDNLIVVAVQEIAVQEERIAELAERLRVVQIKRRSVTPAGRGLDFLHDGSLSHLAEYDALGKRMEELEQELAQARVGLATLDDHLDRLNAILVQPALYIGARPELVRLDRMNVVRESTDDRESREIELLRGYRSDRPGRVLVLIRFKREDLIPERERLAEIERFMGN